MAIARLRLRRAPRDPEARMGVLDHLEELRKRLLISVVAWVVMSLVAWVFYEPLVELVRLPLDAGGKIGDVVVNTLYLPGVTAGFVLRIKLSATAGLVVALPIIIWQVFRFVAPGLSRKERRIAVPFILSSILLFAMGAGLAYLLLPAAIRFLLSFTVGPGLEPLLQFPDYVGFVSFMVVGFGLAFQIPLVIVALGVIGAVSSQTLRSKRPWAIVISFVVAAFATPGGDPLSQTMMAVPLYLLYEAAILVLRFAFKK